MTNLKKGTPIVTEKLTSENTKAKPTPKPKKKKRRRRGTKKYYFTQIHEDAIIKYASSADPLEREELYRSYIQPAFSEMVDKIVYTYKFTNLPNIDDLRNECKVWLTTILDKFDKEKGYKAFSYYSVITKNWFIHEVKKNKTRRRREFLIDDISAAVEEKYITTDNNFLDDLEKKEFWQALSQEISSWQSVQMKPTEEKVYKAVKILLENPDDIEIFNKKAIYLYLRELTGLNTKQVVNNLNKLRAKYRTFKSEWDKGNVKHIVKEKKDHKEANNDQEDKQPEALSHEATS